jgi:hypothetical protein
MMTEYAIILQTLAAAGVQFLIIGGIAAILQGLARATFDVEVVYSREAENIQSLVKALSPFQPYLRAAPPGLPFVFDEKTVRQGLNFTLETTLGALDLMGEAAGGGNYGRIYPGTVEMEACGVQCRCVTLERLIQLKRAAGRPKDLETIAEPQALREERRQRQKT